MTGGAAPAEAYLFGASGIHRGERYTLDREASVLGRGEDAHVRLADPQASRHHCEVRRNEGGFLLRDLLSKNGTSVNGLPVSEKLLEQGDEIRIGETVFFFTFRAKVSPSELLSTRERIEFEDLAARVTMARGPLAGGLVGQDEKMKEIYRQIEKIAAVDVPILVRGETGTGKDLVARTIHENSRRRGHPFVPVNCAALPREILESELFGHEKGAFTGAHAARAGLFE
ncbi:MAG: sigma 54-interacting transcriptional regulator, partial [Planctomycetes bacterium]|nr:sigma 54-interacting transcriptional regulator [Planctomycetota bacterium]